MDNPHLAYSWAKSIVDSIALALNFVIILSNSRLLRKLPHTSVLIFTLCCSDSLALINSWILTTTHIIRNTLDYDKKLCQIHAFLITGGCLLSINLCSVLTFLRYKMIVHCQKVTTKFLVASMSMATFVSFVVAGLPFLLGSQDVSYAMQPSGDDCTSRWHGRDPETLTLVISAITILAVPLAGMGFAYYQIYRKVSTTFEAFRRVSTFSYESSSQSAPGRTSVAMKSNGSGGTRSSIPPTKGTKSEEEEKQMKLLIQSLAIVGVFVVGWAPYFTFAMMEVISGVAQPTELEFAADFVMQLNFVANPIVILVFDEDIRNNVFGKKKKECPSFEEGHVGPPNRAVTLK
ncbi:hypothetical protein BJ741DRAFT_709804 [Chytriomyces cf. hyalinus JEL632]|nr:hypothetical protein BJ741DRAFT_709804 [Chytriomyces cf. hyalinus JEL632]